MVADAAYPSSVIFDFPRTKKDAFAKIYLPLSRRVVSLLNRPLDYPISQKYNRCILQNFLWKSVII